MISVDWMKKVEKIKPKFLEYTDKSNSKRVYKLIEQKLGEKNGRK